MLKTIILVLFLIVSIQGFSQIDDESVMIHVLTELFDIPDFIENIPDAFSEDTIYLGYGNVLNPDMDYLIKHDSCVINIWSRKKIFFYDKEEWILLNETDILKDTVRFTLEFICNKKVEINCTVAFSYKNLKWLLEVFYCERYNPPIKYLPPELREKK